MNTYWIATASHTNILRAKDTIVNNILILVASQFSSESSGISFLLSCVWQLQVCFLLINLCTRGELGRSCVCQRESREIIFDFIPSGFTYLLVKSFLLHLTGQFIEDVAPCLIPCFSSWMHKRSPKPTT